MTCACVFPPRPAQFNPCICAVTTGTQHPSRSRRHVTLTYSDLEFFRNTVTRVCMRKRPSLGHHPYQFLTTQKRHTRRGAGELYRITTRQQRRVVNVGHTRAHQAFPGRACGLGHWANVFALRHRDGLRHGCESLCLWLEGCLSSRRTDGSLAI